jgi:hypothetical protein
MLKVFCRRFIFWTIVLPRLVSYVRNPIFWDRSGTPETFTISDVGNVQRAMIGQGILFFWTQKGEGSGTSFQIEYELRQARQADPVHEVNRVTIGLQPQDRFPCTGMISIAGDGYIIAPSLRLELEHSHEIALMILSPPAAPHNVSLEKSLLAIPGIESAVFISAENGEVRCRGSLPSGYKTARIVLTRNPELTVHKKGFDQELAKIREPGEIVAEWRPVGRDFEERLLVLDPFNIKRYIPDDLLEGFRGPAGEKDTEFFSDFVVGDGVGVNYSISLILDRGLGRHSYDTAKLIVS